MLTGINLVQLMLQTLRVERNFVEICRAFYWETGTLQAGLQRTGTLDGTRHFTLIVFLLMQLLA
jgi:hypothetical protein